MRALTLVVAVVVVVAAAALAGCNGCAAPPGFDTDGGAPVGVDDAGAPLAPCTVDDDCPLGELCGADGCLPAERPPESEGCAGDVDCPEGFLCATSTGSCVEAPPAPAEPPAPLGACDDGDTRFCGSKLGTCEYGVERCAAGAWSGACEGGVGVADEECDGLDNDCNGIVDDGVSGACFVGTAPCQVEGTLACAADGSGVICVVPPSGSETCNGDDDDGDGCVDEGFDVGAGCAAGVGACRTAGARVCSSDGSGTVCGAVAGDPSAELCNNADDDCNNTVDDGCDDDGDDYCDDGMTVVGTPTVCPLTTSATTRDCNDESAAIRPGALEICGNDVDENCDGALDDGCGQPVAVCSSSPVDTEPFVAVSLSGAGSNNPGGGAVTYSWSVTSRPVGSTANPASPTVQTTSFTPDLAGSYEITLTVTNQQGLTDTCVIEVNAVPPESVHVQLVWQESVGDLDLHLTKTNLAPLGAFFDVSAAQEDCWWPVPAPDWGPAGASGNPSLDVDDINGNGPENINIDVNPVNGTYTVGVHLYCEQSLVAGPGGKANLSGPEGPRNAKVRIYCAGDLVDEIPVSPASWRTLSQTGAFWIPAEIVWSGASCTVNRIDSVGSGIKYCRAAGGCAGFANDCRADRDCDVNADCRAYELCLGNGNNKSCRVQTCTSNANCTVPGYSCKAEHGNVCSR